MADASVLVGRDAVATDKRAAAAQEDATAAIPNDTPKPRRRRRWATFCVPLVLLLVAAWFAPAVVARTGLRQRILPLLVPTFPGEIATGSADLDWLAPVALRDVTFRDLEGEPLLHVAAIETSLPLWQVVFHEGDVGRLRFIDPVARIRTRPGGSNVEDVLERMHDPTAAETPATRLGFVLELVNVRVELIDAERPTTPGTLLLPTLDVVRPLDPAAETTLVAKGTLDDGERPGTIGLDIGLRDDETGTLISLRGHVNAVDAPLATLGPLLRRQHDGFAALGRLDADLHCELDGSPERADTPTAAPPTWTARGRAAITHLDARLPGLLADEHLLLQRLELDGSFALANGTVDADGLRLVSDFGRVAFTGSVSLDAAAQPATLRHLLVIVTEHEHDLSATVDLATLVAVLPETTRVRDDLRLDSGTLQIDSSTSARNGRTAWMLRGNVVNLAGRGADTTVRWDEPVHVELDVPRTEQGPAIERIAARADFGNLVARRRDDRGLDLELDADLDALSRQLGRFVNLDGVQFAGRVKGHGSLAQAGGGRWNADLDLETERLVVALPNRRRWDESNLRLTVRAAGRGTVDRLEFVESGELGIVSGDDRLTLRLTEGIAWTDDPTAMTWPVAFDVAGELDRWQTRLAPVAAFEDWTTSGHATVKGAGRFSASHLLVSTCKADLRELQLTGPGVQIAEPSVSIDLNAECNLAEGFVSSPQSTLVCRTAAVRAVDLRCDWSQGGPPRMQGGLAMRIEVDRAQRALGRVPVAYGTLSGSAKFQHRAPVTKSLWSLDLANLDFEGPRLGDDPTPIRLTGRLDYHHERDILAVTTATVATDGLTATTTGRVNSLSTTPTADLVGDLAYDWPRLAPRLRSYLGDVSISGTGTQRLFVKGPLDFSSGLPRDLVASGGLGWQAIDAYGITVGPGALTGSAQSGAAAFAPLDVTVAGGRLRTTPSLVPGPTGSVLSLSPGSTLTDVQLTPELTRQWIGYATPLLGNASRAEGRFSATLSRANVPLADWRTMDAAGQLVIDEARITPGPAATQLVTIVERARQLTGRGNGPRDTSVEASSQTVNVRAAGGRVYHDKLMVRIGGTPVTTTGSVGFDDTLDLVAEFTIPDEWLSGTNDRVARALKGQTLRIPIRGTSSTPQVDGRAVTDLAARAGLNGLLGDRTNSILGGDGGNGGNPIEQGRNRIQDELGSGLEKLFGGRR